MDEAKEDCVELFFLLTQISLSKTELIIMLWFYYMKPLTGYD